ncbi:MAG TPA: hypothetical protein VMW21_02970 [Patescibacteria group bacterium]|nr:hypothetical protein [Patescibacteria group bacterium]
MENNFFQSGLSALSSKSGGGVTTKFIIRAVIVAIAVAAVSLVLGIWDPVWNPFRLSPEEVIEKAVIRMTEKAETWHSEIKFDFSAKEGETEKIKSAIILFGDSDFSDAENLKSAGNFDLTAEIEGMQLGLAGENKTIGQTFYFKLTVFPALSMLEPLFQLMGFNVAGLKNQWIKIDRENTENLLNSLGVPFTSEKSEENKAEEKEIVEKFQTILKNKKLYLVKKEFPNEKIGDKKVYHYAVILNKEEIKKLFPELLKTLIETTQSDSLPEEIEWQEFQDESSAKLDEFFQKTGDFEAEIWIGKKDFYLYKVKMEKEFGWLENETKMTMAIGFDVAFSNFNQPVKIEAPKDYKILEELFTPVFNPLFFEGTLFEELP